jgi:hypothetical protein
MKTSKQVELQQNYEAFRNHRLKKNMNPRAGKRVAMEFPCSALHKSIEKQIGRVQFHSNTNAYTSMDLTI